MVLDRDTKLKIPILRRQKEIQRSTTLLDYDQGKSRIVIVSETTTITTVIATAQYFT